MTGNCSYKRHRTDPSLINRFWSRRWLWLLRKSFHESCCCSWSVLRRFEWHLCLVVECYNLMRTLTSSYSLKEIMDVTTKRGGKRSPDSSIPQPHWQGKGQNLILTGWRQLSVSMRWCCLPSCPARCHLRGCWPRSQEGWRKPLHFEFSPALPKRVTATHACYCSPGARVCRTLVVSSLQPAGNCIFS